MSVETVTLPLVSGRELVFQKPDDATAMRIVRALIRLHFDPTDRTSDVLFFEELATCLLTTPDPAEVAPIATATPADHPYLQMSVAAQWLVILLTNDRAAYARVVALLCDLPAAFMRDAAPPRTLRGKPRRDRH